MNLIGFLVTFPLLLVSVTFHEFAHGWIASKLGDNTAKYSGRLTLNPLAHIDLFGTIIMPISLFILTGGRFVFGAAKPVPVNFHLLKNPKRDIIWVGAAGPLANFALAFGLSVLWKTFPLNPTITFIFWTLISINVLLGVFNLIPIPPLDGSRVLMGLLPEDLARQYAKIEPYGMFIVMGFIFLGLFNVIVEPVVNFMLNWMIK